ncbi:MAG: ABC transporter permease [Rectinema subterraneum]|uniref:ABC transporter permease n=1 Tax=Rectinema subterraneum TaxID=2653714 RepID=UPI003C7E9ED3
MFQSLLAGMDRVTIDAAIDYDSSSISLRSKEYHEHAASQPLEFAIKNPLAIEDRLPALLPKDSTWTQRTRFYVQVSNWIDETPALAFAVEPEKDKEVFKTSSTVQSGAWVSPAKAVIGLDLAKDLGVRIGDLIAVTAILPDGSLNAIELEVGGIADLPLFSLSQQAIYLSAQDAEALVGAPLPVTEIDIRIPPASRLDTLVAQSDAVASALEKAFSGIEAMRIGEAMRDYLAMRNMKSKFAYIVVVIVLLISAVGIFNTVLMSMYSRIREIGVLAAYGLEPGQIKRLFSLERMLIGVIGSAGGVLLGAVFVWWLTSRGIAFGGMFGNLDLGNLPKNLLIKGEWNPLAFIQGFSFGVLVSWLASLMPARKASHIEVTEALRFV